MDALPVNIISGFPSCSMAALRALDVMTLSGRTLVLISIARSAPMAKADRRVLMASFFPTLTAITSESPTCFLTRTASSTACSSYGFSIKVIDSSNWFFPLMVIFAAESGTCFTQTQIFIPASCQYFVYCLTTQLKFKQDSAHKDVALSFKLFPMFFVETKYNVTLNGELCRRSRLKRSGSGEPVNPYSITIR